MCEDPYAEDLLGRQLLQVGNRFHLLPFRRYPVEEMYESPLRVVLSTDEQVAFPVFQVATDGSSRQLVGGFAAVLMPAYADIGMAVVGKGKMRDIHQHTSRAASLHPGPPHDSAGVPNWNS